LGPPCGLNNGPGGQPLFAFFGHFCFFRTDFPARIALGRRVPLLGSSQVWQEVFSFADFSRNGNGDDYCTPYKKLYCAYSTDYLRSAIRNFSLITSVIISTKCLEANQRKTSDRSALFCDDIFRFVRMKHYRRYRNIIENIRKLEGAPGSDA